MVSRLVEDRGNALLEGVGFVAVAFGLLITASFQLFSVQKQSLELATLARNVMREHLLDSSRSFDEFVAKGKQGSSLETWPISVRQYCATECVSGSLIELELQVDNISARAFGIVGD